MKDKFWRRVDRSEDCWLWQGYITQSGYGQLGWGKKLDYAHRVAYEISVGEIPEDLVLDHLCRNRACVNPKHLEIVTRGENVMRGEGVAPINARKTHCIRGHELDGRNVHFYKTERVCRTCRGIRKKLSRQMIKEKVMA